MDVGRKRDGLHQRRVDANAHEDEKVLKAESQQGFEVVSADVAPLSVSDRRHRDRTDGAIHIDFQKAGIYNGENVKRQCLDGHSDNKGFRPKPEQFGWLHGL